MSGRFEELDWADTPKGELSLRRRRDPVADVTVYEVKLDDEFLMSSLFTTAEEELARLALRACAAEQPDVLVGGLGLGYTAAAALESARVRRVDVIEALAPVISWHRDLLLPAASTLVDDPRCTLVLADFFEVVAGRTPAPVEAYDAVLLDIDHTPTHLLHEDHAAFYSEAGLERLTHLLRPDGVLGVWSDGPPVQDFVDLLGTAFEHAVAEVVAFANPLTRGTSSSTVYVARDVQRPWPAPTS